MQCKYRFTPTYFTRINFHSSFCYLQIHLHSLYVLYLPWTIFMGRCFLEIFNQKKNITNFLCKLFFHFWIQSTFWMDGNFPLFSFCLFHAGKLIDWNQLTLNYCVITNRTKSNQRWMKLRTTVQISSAIQKKPPLKREDSFLKRFSTRQIPETQVRFYSIYIDLWADNFVSRIFPVCTDWSTEILFPEYHRTWCW